MRTKPSVPTACGLTDSSCCYEVSWSTSLSGDDVILPFRSISQRQDTFQILGLLVHAYVSSTRTGLEAIYPASSSRNTHNNCFGKIILEKLQWLLVAGFRFGVQISRSRDCHSAAGCHVPLTLTRHSQLNSVLGTSARQWATWTAVEETTPTLKGST
jgi:hypothetical protein